LPAASVISVGSDWGVSFAKRGGGKWLRRALDEEEEGLVQYGDKKGL
jgi:hypothetical protein